jgi:hypothetical protein
MATCLPNDTGSPQCPGNTLAPPHSALPNSQSGLATMTVFCVQTPAYCRALGPCVVQQEELPVATSCLGLSFCLQKKGLLATHTASH